MTPFVPEESRNRPSPPAAFPLLDAIRFLAAAAVMLNHLRGNQFLPFSEVQCTSGVAKRVFYHMTRLGVESVVMFFVLSGFLVGGLSFDRFLRSRFDPRKYFVDRFARIYTPLIPIVLLTACVSVALGFPISTRDVFVNLASIQGAFGEPIAINLSLWSLTYEVWFYLLCGSFLTLLNVTGYKKWPSFGFVVASAFVFTRLDVAYLFAWLFGAGAFFLKAQRPLALAIVGIPLAITGVVTMQATSVSVQVDLKSFAWIDRSFAILTLASGCALIVAAASQIPAHGAIARVFKWLAGFSYTLYLIHMPLIIVLVQLKILLPFDRLTPYTVACFIGTGAAVCGFAWLVYLPLEKQTPHVRQWCYAYLLSKAEKAAA